MPQRAQENGNTSPHGAISPTIVAYLQPPEGGLRIGLGRSFCARCGKRTGALAPSRRSQHRGNPRLFQVARATGNRRAGGTVTDHVRLVGAELFYYVNGCPPRRLQTRQIEGWWQSPRVNQAALPSRIAVMPAKIRSTDADIFAVSERIITRSSEAFIGL